MYNLCKHKYTGEMMKVTQYTKLNVSAQI